MEMNYRVEREHDHRPIEWVEALAAAGRVDLLQSGFGIETNLGSGYGREETIARAFETGAEDYIVKPFSLRELVAWVGAEPSEHGELTIDYERRQVTVGDRVVPLTSTEHDLLGILSVNAGRVVSSESLLRQVWGERKSNKTEPVRSFVKKLRDKLGDSPAAPTWIFNVRGVGYRMSEPGEEDAP